MDTNIAIAGCRTFDNYLLFESSVYSILDKIKPQGNIIILSGHCKGTDMLAEKFAELYGYKIKIFPAQWDIYGKMAGPIRNKIMVECADYVIAFWDKKSKGTKNLINITKQMNKPIYIEYI